MILEQYLPALHQGDAVGESTIRLHRFLQAAGGESTIISLQADPEVAHLTVPWAEHKPKTGAIRLLHHAVPSDLTHLFPRLPGPKVLVYHNITPMAFFEPYSPHLAEVCRLGRAHLKHLVGKVDLALADSRFNAEELEETGFDPIRVFPVMIDHETYQNTPSSEAYAKLFADGRKNLLFVGRLVPNKGVDHLIRTLFTLRKYLNPNVRLIVAGNDRLLPAYTLGLWDLGQRFLLGGDDLFFTGHVSFRELMTLFRISDLYVTMSGHEGFGVPLMEACFMGLPVCALDRGATSETLGEAGLLLGDTDPMRSALLWNRCLEDGVLRQSLKDAAVRRAGTYLEASNPARLLSLLEEAF